VNSGKAWNACITRAPAEIRAWHSPYHLPNLFFRGGIPAYEKAYRPKKVNSRESNSTIAKLLSGEFICKTLLCWPLCRMLILRVRIPSWGTDVCLSWTLCCEIKVFATGRSLVQRVPSVVCLRLISEHLQWGSLGPSIAGAPHPPPKQNFYISQSHTQASILCTINTFRHGMVLKQLSFIWSINSLHWAEFIAHHSRTSKARWI
jgi:hypothetical protein